MKNIVLKCLIILALLLTITSPVLSSIIQQKETVIEETINCGTLGCTDGGGLAISFLFNLAPGYFNERAVAKHVDNIFKNTDEIIDITGKVIKRTEYLDFVRNIQKIGVKIDYENIFDTFKKLDGDILKIGKVEVEGIFNGLKQTDEVFVVDDFLRVKDSGFINSPEEYLLALNYAKNHPTGIAPFWGKDGIYNGTSFPKQFHYISSSNKHVTVIESGTKHVQDLIKNSGVAGETDLASMLIMKDMQSTIDEIIIKNNIIEFNKIYTQGKWEVVFSQPRTINTEFLIHHFQPL